MAIERQHEFDERCRLSSWNVCRTASNMSLEDALTAKVEAAEQRGEWWHPLMR